MENYATTLADIASQVYNNPPVLDYTQDSQDAFFHAFERQAEWAASQGVYRTAITFPSHFQVSGDWVEAMADEIENYGFVVTIDWANQEFIVQWGTPNEEEE